MTGGAEESSTYREPMSDAAWHEALHACRLRLAVADRGEVLRLGAALREALAALDGPMNRWCAETCPECPDACCDARRVFFNRADVLAVLALGEPPPPGQTRTGEGAPCRYLGAAGCGLSRFRRPYVCVWYLCEGQMRLFGREPPAAQRRLLAAMQEVRRVRLRLEALWEAARP